MNKFSFFNYTPNDFKKFEFTQIIESKAIESKAIEPKAIEPKAIEPKAVESKAIEPKAIEPKAIEPKAVESKAIAIPIAKCVNYKKKKIPKHIKTLIWNKYIGDDIMKHKCLCCKKETIRNTDFEAGHVLSEYNGGSNEIDNLRPICRLCNASMGTMHMIDYIKMYGLYI